VWERVQLSDFKSELVLLPFLILAILVHVWGTRTNRRKAKKWMAAHAPVLNSEFALVGFGSRSSQLDGQITADNLPADLMKEKTAQDYQSYATGRQNIGWVDLKLRLLRLPNPPLMGAEWLLSLFFESFPAPRQTMETIVYSFDGNEKKFVVPGVPGSDEVAPRTGSSAYDGFVFAIVNKSAMRHLRDERYDVSLTYTKDHAKLPAWATVMSEAAEVTETLLTKDLVAAVQKAGEALEYIIVTDLPIDKPTKLDEAAPRKRLYLCMKVPPGSDYSDTLPLFQAFLRLPDHLAQNAHFRPEVLKKLNQTREAEIKKLKRVGDEEAEEERKRLAEKVKKEERDRKMRGMTAEEQRKFLEKESDRKRRKDEKKMTRKG
jgi:signal transduction histidine kinase